MKKILKKVLALSLCMCMMVGMATGASAAEKGTNRFTDKQMDILMAYGVEKVNINNLTDEEIVRILDNNPITHPEHLEKYYGSGTSFDTRLYSSSINILSQVKLPSRQLKFLMSQGYGPEEILNKYNNNEYLPVPPAEIHTYATNIN